MIEYQKEYVQWLMNKGVGNHDKVASSPASYVSYLKSVSQRIKSNISPANLSSDGQIDSMLRELRGIVSTKSLKWRRLLRQVYKQ